MIPDGIVHLLLARGVRVYVNPLSGLAQVTGRLVLQPVDKVLARYARSYRFMLENLAFASGTAMDPEVFVVKASIWCNNENCELIVAPDRIGDPLDTLRLHMRYLEYAPQWMVEKSLAVIHMSKPDYVVAAARDMLDMGFKRIAVPSDNRAAMRLIHRIKKYADHVHVLGCQAGCLQAVLHEPIDSIDIYRVSAHA